MPSQEAIDEIALREADSKRQSREFLAEIVIDDIAQKAAILRSATARGYAMDPSPYSRPYPGSTVSKQVVNNPGTGSSLLTGLLGPALAAMGAAGTTLGGLAYYQATKTPAAPAAQVAPIENKSTETSSVKPIDLKVKWWYEGDQLKSEVVELTPEEAEKLRQEKESQK